MLSAQGLSQLIGKVYDAALGDLAWPELVRDMARAFSAPIAGIRIGGEDGASSFIVDIGLDASMRDAYRDYYWSQDFVLRRMVAGRRGVPLPIENMANDRRYAHNEFVNEFLRPIGCSHGINCMTQSERGFFMQVGIGRSAQQAPFSSDDIRALALLAPHFARAHAVRQRARPLDEATDERLRDEFGFTPKEAQLAEVLMRGQRLVTAARTLGISHETARSHLKNMYQKTATHSQVELAHALARAATHKSAPN